VSVVDDLPRARPVSPDLIHGTTPGENRLPTAWNGYGPPDPGRLHSAPPPPPVLSARKRHWAVTFAKGVSVPTALAMATWVSFAVVCVVFIVVFGAPPSVTGPLWFWFTRTGTIGAAIPVAVGLGLTVAATVLRSRRPGPHRDGIAFAWVAVFCAVALECIGIAIVTN
jgi:hypothetical protein